MAQQGAIFMQLHTPTGVTHCVSAYLTHASSGGGLEAAGGGAMPNLVLARGTAIDVYSLKLIAGEWKLAVCGRFPLFGVVESLEVLRGGPGQRDAILVTFREAKLCVLYWDAETADLVPSGLHYFEGDPALMAGRTVFPTPPMAVSDPQGRCAAVVMFRHQLAVLPTVQEGGAEGLLLPFLGLEESQLQGGGVDGGAVEAWGGEAAALGNSYVDNLAKAGIKEVRDAAFLHGYNEPVLLLLHEDDLTWAGSLRTKKDTCCLTALSLNLSAKRHPRIWAVQHLPYDAQRIVPVPSGGALVLCTHMVLFYSQGHQVGVVVNSAALGSVPPPPPLQFDLMREMPSVAAAKYAQKYACSTHPDAVSAAVRFCDTESAIALGLELDGARATWLPSPSHDGQHVLLLALRSGQLALVRPVLEAGGVRRLQVYKAGAAPPASCLTTLCRGLLFLGSHQGDSLLVRATPVGPSAGPTPQPAAAAGAAGGAGRAGASAVADGPPQHGSAGTNPAETGSMPGGAEAVGSTPATVGLPGGAGQEAEHPPKRRRLAEPDADGGEAAAGPGQTETGSSAAGAAAAGGESPEEGKQEGEQEGEVEGGAAAGAEDGTVEDYAESGGEEEGEGEGEGVADSESDEEALIYGDAAEAEAGGATGVTAAAAEGGLRYKLKIMDSLVNIGPIRDMAVGGLGSPDYPPFVVTCGGRERGGALCMLRQHVTPDVIIDVPLQGMLGVWAVHHRSEDAQGPPTPGAADTPPAAASALEDYHSYLLISFQGSTMIMAVEEELQDVSDSVEFATDTPTLAAGSVCGGRRIVQVFPQGVRVLVGGEELQNFWSAELFGDAQQGAGAQPGAGATIASASILDPYVLLTSSQGSATLLQADPSSGCLAVAQHGRHVLKSADTALITAGCLHLDSAALLASQQQQQLVCLLSARQRAEAGAEAEDGGPAEQGSPSVHCCLCRADGQLEVYALPGWQLVFKYRNMGEGPAVLDNGGAAPTDSPDGVSPARIVELRLESFGTPQPAPGQAGKLAGPGPSLLTLVALTSEDTLLVYRAFLSPQGALKFRRLHPHLPPTLPPAAASSSSDSSFRPSRITRFDGLGEELPFWGLFIAGASPAFLVATRGTLFAHPLYLPPGLSATGFTPFNNVNCPNGFITACVGEGIGSLRICQPPPRTRLDCPWPRAKVPLRATPLKIAHYPEADLFAVLAARQVPSRDFLPEEEGGEPHASYAYATAAAAAKHRGVMEGHEVRLVDPETWATTWRHSLLPGEHALSVHAVHLRDATTGGTVPLLAVGAGFVAGEDYPVLGRVLLFRVHRKAAGAAAGAGQGPEWTATLVYSREFRGPVSAVACIEGYLLLSAGNRIETLALATAAPPEQPPAAEGGEALQPGEQQPLYKFTRTAFFDGPMLVTSLNVVKNFVLLGDAQHSVQFVRYTDEGRQLAMLSKDFNRADATATEFLINGTSLHMVCGDGGGVLRLLSYATNHPGSWRGQKLVPWGAFQLGGAPLSMLRMQLRPADSADKVVRQAVLMGDASGCIGAVSPLVRADSLQVLKALQRELTIALRHTAGLNPASFRMQHARLTQGPRGVRWFGQPLPDAGVLDGDLLRQYSQLPRGAQARVARAAGSSREAVLALLADTVSTSLVF